MNSTKKIVIIAIGVTIGTFLFYTLMNLYNLHQLKVLATMKPVVTQINFPDKSNNEEAVRLKDVILVFPIGESKIYFEAKDKNGILKIDSDAFNSLIKNQEKLIGKTKFTIVVKAPEKAQYKDMVDLLDKLSALSIKRYSIVQITKDDNKRIESFLSKQSP